MVGVSRSSADRRASNAACSRRSTDAPAVRNHPMVAWVCNSGTTSGSLYPALAKLERAGWIVGEREPIDPREEGRPARRYYMLTAEGATTGAAALAEFSQQFRPSTLKSGVLGQIRDATCRPRPAGGIA